MPHATIDVNVNVNGDTNTSRTVSHLKSYPAVSDSIETFKSNPLGKKSLEIVDSAYARFGKPVEPYLNTPYSYAKPYVSKADELGERALSTVEGRFPIVKEKTGTIIEKTKSTVFWPYSYLYNTWNDEYTKTANHNNRGPGVTTSVLSLVSLELRVASDFFHYVADNLRPAYEEGKAKADDLAKSAQQTLGNAQQTLGEYEKYGKDKLNQLQGEAQKKTEEVKGSAQQLKGDAEKKAHEAKGSAQQTKDDAQRKLQK